MRKSVREQGSYWKSLLYLVKNIDIFWGNLSDGDVIQPGYRLPTPDKTSLV